jgi:hypothetical protein
MGCHTWFYRKVNRTLEEARELYIKDHKKSIIRFKEMLNNPEDEVRAAYSWTDENLDHAIKIMERQVQMVEKELCNVAVFNHQPEDHRSRDYEFEKKNNTLYCTDDELPHDIFRIGGYPEDRLFSLEETLQYLGSHDDKIGYADTIFNETDRNILKESAIKRLKKFWEDHPDGMIEFG